MAPAAFEGFLKFILILGLIYFAVKFTIKWFGPSIMRYFLRKISNKASEKFNNASGFQEKNNTGKTTIDSNPPNRQQSNKDAGEYIDYEEID